MCSIFETLQKTNMSEHKKPFEDLSATKAFEDFTDSDKIKKVFHDLAMTIQSFLELFTKLNSHEPILDPVRLVNIVKDWARVLNFSLNNISPAKCVNIISTNKIFIKILGRINMHVNQEEFDAALELMRAACNELLLVSKMIAEQFPEISLIDNMELEAALLESDSEL